MKPETISLISNVSLSEIGWRKKVYALIFIDCLCKEQLTYDGLKLKCKESLGSIFNENDFNDSITYAVTDNQIEYKDDSLVVTEGKKNELCKSEEIRLLGEEETKNYFISICKNLGINEIDWDIFRDYFIIENIKVFILDGRDFESIYNEYTSRLTGAVGSSEIPTVIQIRAIIDGLLESKNATVKAYLLSYIHGYFNIESLGLQESSLNSFRPEPGKTYKLKLVLDTNYVFSILKLHDNPANDLVNSIQEISKKLKGKFVISYHVHPRTIKEFQHSLEYEIKKLCDIKFSIPIAKAIVSSSSVSGVTKQFAEQYLKANGALKVSDYIEPYTSSLTTILKNFGINIYNSTEDVILKSDEYLQDLSNLIQKNDALKEDRRRGFSSIEHDLLLWHTVNNARPLMCDTFLEAKIWIATIDHRFVDFDKSKKAAVPICLEPSVILDILQIWLPRDEILNEQLLNIIRIPLYSHEFVKDAEAATAKIISLISRFSSADGLTEDTIHKLLLNKTLRERIVTAKSQEEEVQLIQDNLLNFIDDANKEKERIELERRNLELQFKNKEIEVLERDAKLQNLELEQKKQSETLNGLKSVVDDVHNKNLQITSEKCSLEERLTMTQQKLDEQMHLNKMNDQWQLHWDELSKQGIRLPIFLISFALI